MKIKNLKEKFDAPLLLIIILVCAITIIIFVLSSDELIEYRHNVFVSDYTIVDKYERKKVKSYYVLRYFVVQNNVSLEFKEISVFVDSYYHYRVGDIVLHDLIDTL